MKMQEIKALSTEELKSRIDEEKKAVDTLKFNHSLSPLDNPMSIRAKRHDVARMLTELSLREADAKVENI